MTAPATATWHCPPKSILVAVDFGDASARAVELAGVIAGPFDASLRAVHAERFEPPPYFTLEQIERLQADRKAAQAAAVAHVAEFAARAGARAVSPVVADEPPVDAILRAARGADLIVMGTHGRRGPGRWWLGSVAERVVRAADVPVLVTRAAQSPAADVFRRITLVHDGTDGASGRACADALAPIARAEIVDGGTAARCDADLVARSSLVIVTRAGEPAAWALADPTARVLTHCDAPVLFVPARG